MSQTGKLPKELASIPKMPNEMVYLFEWFCELDMARGGNGFGINPLGFTEISAWAQLTRNCPQPWEIEVLRRLDAVRIRVANEK